MDRLAACGLRLAAVFVALAPACIHRPAPVRLAQSTTLSLAVVIDREHEILKSHIEGAPDEIVARLSASLEDRNVAVRPVAEEKRAELEAARETKKRLADLNAAAGDASLILLAETRVVFYELLQGRYKWTVYAKLTIARKDDLQNATSAEVDVPVFLLYDHEREPEAMRAAAPGLAERAGTLVDDFLRGRPELKREASGPRGPIYFVLVDRFANGDKTNDAEVNPADPAAFHGGDLQGVIDRLDWLQALGVETVWLSPVFQMRTAKFYEYGAFHGYWVEDFNRIEPRFGNAQLLRKLSDELHARGMKLLLDVVLNHVAMDAPLTKQHPEWFHHLGPIRDWNNAEEVESHDVHGLPDLAQEREDVYQFLLQASLKWIEEAKPDGFRLDAVKHVPLAFWKRYSADLHARAGGQFWLLGEALDGEPEKLAKLLREGGFDSLFDFPLKFALTDVFCKGRPVGRIAATLTLDSLYGGAANQLVTLLDNHDLPRVLSECNNDAPRVLSALKALFGLRGIPSIQYGTEVGLTGQHEPASRGDMRFEQSTLGDAIAGLTRFRAAHPALTQGETRVIGFTDDVVTILRATREEAAVLAINRGTRSTEIIFPPWFGFPDFRDETGALVRGVTANVPPEHPAQGVSLAAGVVRLLAVQPGSSDFVSASPGELYDRARRRDARAIELVVNGAHPTGELYVAGAGPELGSWNPARALGPVRAALALKLTVGSVYEFKLLLKRADGSVAWEAGEDRFLFVDEGDGPLRVTAQWRAAQG